jgi:hypothetical protein
MIITIIPITIPIHHDAHKSAFGVSSLMEGARFIRKSRIIFSTIMLDFSATFFGSATSLLPIFAVDILRVDSGGLGLLYAATSAGAVVAGMILSGMKKVHHQGRIIVGSVLLYGCATVGFGLSRSFYLSLACLALAGAGDMISTILRNNIRQSLTPAPMRGRMTGINILFAQGGPKLGDAEAGFVAAATSGPVSVVIGGIGTIASTLAIVAAMPRLHSFKGDELAA